MKLLKVLLLENIESLKLYILDMKTEKYLLLEKEAFLWLVKMCDNHWEKEEKISSFRGRRKINSTLRFSSFMFWKENCSRKSLFNAFYCRKDLFSFRLQNYTRCWIC